MAQLATAAVWSCIPIRILEDKLLGASIYIVCWEGTQPSLTHDMLSIGAKDIGNLATARGGGTAPDVIRAPKRHADTVSEDESSMELVELLRGSEEDPEEVVAEQHAPVVISSQSDVEVDNVEIKAPEIYIHDSVVRSLCCGSIFYTL